jgi:phosphoglycerate dehydrogenase-like enzyme
VKILFCSKSYPQAGERLSALLPDHEISSCDSADIVNNLAGVDVLVPTAIPKIDDQVMRSGTFGLIQQLGVGLDNIDIEAATKYGVWVAPVPGAGSGNAESVAELTILFMLALYRRLYEARDNIAKGVFFRPGGKSLLGKTVCIVGFGDIGKAVAERLTPFGMEIIAARRNPDKPANGDLKLSAVYGMDRLDKALADADFVVLALPETKETDRLMNARTIAMMKEGSFLINVGRGGVIDEQALLDALESGHLAGCGLDVFWREPMDPAHPLFKYNVVATPHIGGNTDASFIGVTNVIADNVRRYAAGEKPLHVVNQPESARRKAKV